MTAVPLPARPDLDQLKRQAKELVKAWRHSPSTAPPQARLRDAQRSIAQQHGFASWDALRAHVEQLSASPAGAERRPRRGMDYDDPILDVITLRGPLTRDDAQRLAEQAVSGVKLDESVPPESFAHLVHVPTLRRLDLSGRDDVGDGDLAFLEGMPWLTALSLAHCGRIGDDAVRFLRPHQALEQINLRWTGTGDASVAALAGKPALFRVVLGGRLTDAGVARLREFPALATAGVDDVFLSVSGGRTLTDAALAVIGDLAGVAALDLHTSVFGSPHFTARGAAHLRRMTMLEELNFHGRLATDAVLREIAGIPRLRALHCQDIASGDEGFAALGGCVTLESLGARVCPRVTDRGLAALAQLPRLSRLGLGGPRLTDAALAPLADVAAIEELTPILFGDEAFAHIARLPRLAKLTNMYNRATTDGATRHLRAHARLDHYSAFGTQITDESLRILADLPRLESLEFENCAGITDDGLRAIARLPRLRRLSAWSCINVQGTWTSSLRAGIEAKSEPGPPGHAAGYRFETLMAYPTLPIPADAATPHGSPPSSGLLPALACLGGQAEFVEDGGVRLSVPPGMDTRWMGLITREVYETPLRIDMVVGPITELRLFFGRANSLLVLDAQGDPQNPAPWFLELEAEKGTPHGDDDREGSGGEGFGGGAGDDADTSSGSRARARAPLGEWPRVTMEIDAHERRLSVNGAHRHTWPGDFAGLRSRIGIGLRQSSLTVRSLRVEPGRGRTG